MNCPGCNLEISEIDSVCPFCNIEIINNTNTPLKPSNEDCILQEDTLEQSSENIPIDINNDYVNNDIDFLNSTTTDILLETTENSDFTEIITTTDNDFEPVKTTDNNLGENADSITTETNSVYSDEKQKITFLEKVLIYLSGEKKPLNTTKSQGKMQIFCIISAIPLMFWLPYILHKKTKTLLFFSNQSFKLTLLMLINSLLLLTFEILPFYKTISYVKNGILFYSSVKYVPLVIIIIASILGLLFLTSAILNVYSAVIGKTYNFLPFKRFNIIK